MTESKTGDARERSLKALLIADAIEQISCSPEDMRGWHLLLARIPPHDVDFLLWTAAELDARIPSRGLAGFFKQQFLSTAGGHPDRLPEAANLLLEVLPRHAERLVTFATYEWGRQLYGVRSREEFVAALRSAAIPEIVMRLGVDLLPFVSALPTRLPDAIRKVAVLAPTLAPGAHTPSKLAVEHARRLSSLGMSVELFACQETEIEEMPALLPNRGHAKAPQTSPRDVAAMLGSGMRVHLSDAKFSLMRRWRDMLRSIGQFDPDAVLFVGLHSPLVIPLHQQRPVLGLNVHTFAPMVPVDAWLCGSESSAAKRDTLWSPAIPPAWGIHYPYRIGANTSRPCVPRTELGIEANTVLLVSVGYRLQQEINGSWAERMVRFMAQHQDAVWLLVGGAGKRPAGLDFIPERQLRLLPHRDDVRGILQDCDVYVNPPRMGGGFSVAEAMAEGLPVLSYAESDGGDKVGDHALKDDEAYFSRLDEYVVDAPLRKAKGQVLKARFVETLSLSKANDALQGALSETLARFQARSRATMNDIHGGCFE